MLAVYSGLPCLTMREGFSACFRCMGQHVLPAGSNLRNIVFRDQILFVELDHGFQFTIPDSCLLLLPDIPAVFTLTGKKRLSESCVPIRPFQFLSPREDQMTCPTLWVFVVRVTRRYTANAETDKKQPSNGELPFDSHRDSFCLWPWADHALHKSYSGHRPFRILHPVINFAVKQLLELLCEQCLCYTKPIFARWRSTPNPLEHLLRRWLRVPSNTKKSDTSYPVSLQYRY